MAKKLFVASLIGLFIVVIIIPLGYFVFYGASMSLFIDDSEEVFREYILEGKDAIPDSVTQIQGLEKTHLDPLRGPAYIHFNADRSFIERMIEKQSHIYESYVQIPCPQFFGAIQRYDHIETYSDQFEWWTPEAIENPLCYRAERKHPHYDDEARYLLVDISGNDVHFFRTTTPLTSFY